MDYYAAHERVKAAKKNRSPQLPHPYFMQAQACFQRPSRVMLKVGDGRQREPFDYKAPLVIGQDAFDVTHVALMLDLYNKVATHGVDPQQLKQMLRGLEPMKSAFGFPDLPAELRGYEPQGAPVMSLRSAVGKAIQGTGHGYAADHNRYDLHVDELFHLTFWIALQEEINYGEFRTIRKHPGWGRHLPLVRYQEAVAAGEAKDVAELEKACNAACNMGRPPPPRIPGFDYGF